MRRDRELGRNRSPHCRELGTYLILVTEVRDLEACRHGLDHLPHHTCQSNQPSGGISEYPVEMSRNVTQVWNLSWRAILVDSPRTGTLVGCTRGKLTAAAVDAGDGKPGHGGLGGVKGAMTGAGVGRGLGDTIKGLLLCPPIMRVASRC